jgi:hypothetical protein
MKPVPGMSVIGASQREALEVVFERGVNRRELLGGQQTLSRNSSDPRRNAGDKCKQLLVRKGMREKRLTLFAAGPGIWLPLFINYLLLSFTAYVNKNLQVIVYDGTRALWKT